MKRKPTLKALRNRLDKVFSAFIRRRDCLPNGFGRCISCGAYAELQAGHFIKRQHLATRWDSLNCHGQCVRCNHYLRGNEGAYCLALIKKFGEQTVEELMELKHKIIKFNRQDLEEMIERYSG